MTSATAIEACAYADGRTKAGRLVNMGKPGTDIADIDIADIDTANIDIADIDTADFPWGPFEQDRIYCSEG